MVDSDLIYRRLMDVVFSAASLPADSPVNTDPRAKQQIQVMTRLWSIVMKYHLDLRNPGR